MPAARNRLLGLNMIIYQVNIDGEGPIFRLEYALIFHTSCQLLNRCNVKYWARLWNFSEGGCAWCSPSLYIFRSTRGGVGGGDQNGKSWSFIVKDAQQRGWGGGLLLHTAEITNKLSNLRRWILTIQKYSTQSKTRGQKSEI